MMRFMDECCAVAPIAERQRRVFVIVLWINVAMFLLEAIAGIVSYSTALLADSVDMLGDAIVYGFSLYAVGRGAMWQARAATLKGAVMAAFGLGVLAQAVVKITQGLVPSAEIMGVIGLLALAANVVCLTLLWRHRADDINMRSAWVCSRNDVIGNLGVLLAAVGVTLTGSAWPDIGIGVLVAAVFCRSAIQIIKDARQETQLSH
jgi:cation diffusion facilitator family transporter